MLYYYGLENNCSHAHLGLNSLDEGEDAEKKRAHSSLQDRLDKELQELDKCLKQKEAEMKRFAKVDTSALELHYVNKLLELVQEKKALQKEIEELCHNLANISNTSADSAQNLKEDYLMKVSELKKKQDAQSQLLRQKQKSDDAAKRLQDGIQRIKSHKLKKEGRRNEYEMHRLLVLNQRQKMVLQRKTEEASLATKRLRELLESKGTCDTSGSGHASGPGIQPLMQAIKHELEVRFRVHEVRTAYERQMQERAAMAKEVARLKEESENFKQKIMSDCLQTMSPSARNSRIVAPENMLAATSGMLACMASQLSEAEECEHVFSGRDRWNQIRSLAEAKNLMKNLFNLASSSSYSWLLVVALEWQG